MKIVSYPSDAAERRLRRVEVLRDRSERIAEASARKVVAAIERGGDDAVVELVAKFDDVEIDPRQLVSQPVKGEMSRELSDAIDMAIERVERFHLRQLPPSYVIESDGLRLTHRVRPLRRVGIYVPGGKAVYLSTLIMCAVPARLAGVRSMVVATTPAAAAREEFQECCRRLGIDVIYRAGGAAGIAAMAIGTASLERVDKIVGPGNVWVTAAKKLLTGRVGIDMLAGPTELIVIADSSADPDSVAADLLSQAEHGADSVVICIVFEKSDAQTIVNALDRRTIDDASRGAWRTIEQRGLMVVCDSIQRAAELANRVGPEHLSLHLRDAVRHLEAFENCGAVFAGGDAPVAAGDYIAGPNHVLPTAGSARFTSPLGVYDFVKRTNVVECTHAGISSIAGAGAAIADFEGLPMHAASMRLRAGRGAR